MRYVVNDAGNRAVEFTEKTSIILTVVTVLAGIATIALFGLGALTLINGSPAGVGGVVAGLVMLINVFVLNHLRKKGDMNTGKAEFIAVDGRRVEVVKKSSVWITLAMAFAVIGLIISLATLAIAPIMPGTASFAAAPQSMGDLVVVAAVQVVILLLWIAVLNFLRTKIDFAGESVTLRTASGQLIELYKRKSFWILLGTVFSALTGVVMLGVAAYSLIQGTVLQLGSIEVELGGLAAAASAGVAGLVALIWAAVLNFLRVRGHVRPLA